MNKIYKVIDNFLDIKGELYHVGDLWYPDLMSEGLNANFIEKLESNGFIKEVVTAAPDFGVIATSKLAGVEIADSDYISEGKEYFTYDEALEVEKKLKGTGWRLPTRHEWVLICEELGCNKNGNLDSKMLLDRLGLTLKGYEDFQYENVYSQGTEGNYWSRSAHPTYTNFAYSLAFSASAVSPSNYYNRYLGFSLRLVRNIKKECSDE